jgi:glucose/arabinose dehydrogenase
MLYVTVGDTFYENPMTGQRDGVLAQTDGSMAGRVLRIAPDGSIPADNPIANDPEWCRGLRNSYDLTFHPTTGGLFVSENGPAAGDELNFVQKGKNFEWGAEPESIPGVQIGAQLAEWTPVIVPTGLVFHSGTQFGPSYANNLFLCGYDDADVRRMPMSGAAFTDVDAELPFARFSPEGGVDHKPLDIVERSDGSLLVSTFSEIWRIFRY